MINVLDPEFYVDPWQAYRWLRDEAPLYWDPVQKLWVISRYDDVLEVERAAGRYCSSEGSRPLVDQRQDMSMINMDEPGHQEQRRLVSGWSFADPDTLDVTRAPNRHLAFGAGAHLCLGAHLARLEIRVLFGELLRRMPDWELACPAEPRIIPATFTRAYDRIRITFTRAGRNAIGILVRGLT